MLQKLERKQCGSFRMKRTKGSFRLRYFLCAAPGAVCPVVKRGRGSIYHLTPALPAFPAPACASFTTTDITTALCHAWCVSGSPRSGPGFSTDNITG